jgi:Zn-dependent protease
VFLLEPDHTPWDLKWNMFGIPIRVHPMFWVLSAVLGWGYVYEGVPSLLIWIGCVFVSILIHELGHVFMGRAFGTDGHIVLYTFGGLAIGSNNLSNRGQRILVAFAGPLAGFLFVGALMAVIGVFRPEYLEVLLDKLRNVIGLPGQRTDFPPDFPPLLKVAILDLLWINLFWGLLNLLPIWPLDGGQISRDFFTGMSRQNGLRISLGISLVLSGLLAIQAFSVHVGHPLIPFLGWLEGVLPGSAGMYMAIFFGIFALQSFLLLQRAEQRPWREDWPDRWDRDPWRR